MTTPPPVPPKVTSITYSPTAPTPGQTVTATVKYTPGASVATYTGTGTVKDTTTGLTGSLTASFQVPVPDPTSAAGFSDDGHHTWALVSDSAGTAVYTTTV